MATDIVLDDKSGTCVTINCDEVATSGHVTVDNPVSRSGAAGDRIALRHDTQDGLSINPGRDYPFGVTIQCTNLNLKVNDQKGMTPELPKRGERGDMLLLCNHFRAPLPDDVPPVFVESCTLWLCVGPSPTGAASWAPIALGPTEIGTI